MTKTKKIEIEKATAEVFLTATKFFESAGVHFIEEDAKVKPYGLRICIIENSKGVKIVSPFEFHMTRDTLAGLYVALVKGANENNIRKMIAALNRAIVNGYWYDEVYSHHIETLKNNDLEDITVDYVVKSFVNIIKEAIGDITVKNNGDLYRILGGEKENQWFFTEVLRAVANSIPELEDVWSTPATQYLPKIACYTCKHAKVDRESGKLMCMQYAHTISGEEYSANPKKWIDGVYSPELEAFVSHIIDERCVDCEGECRIKR